MRIGLIARMDNTGLGNQTWEFYRHMQPAKTLVIDISMYNHNEQHPERYDGPGVKFLHGFPAPGDLREFLQGLDVVFTAETPYNYALYTIAREMGVKTAAQYNYEFLDWYAHPDWPTPDMLIAPTSWHYGDVDTFCKIRGIKHVQLPCPVATDRITPRHIQLARHFVHPAGKPAAHDRNGTEAVIKASALMKSPLNVRIELHFQGEQTLQHQLTHTTQDYRDMVAAFGDPERIDFVVEDYPYYWQQVGSGDMLVLPRRYGGNCLPMHEALAAGMPVIMPDISPNNDLLLTDWLLPAEHTATFQPRATVAMYDVDPACLAAKMDDFAAMPAVEFDYHNTMACGLAQRVSWGTWQPKYMQVLEQLCRQ